MLNSILKYINPGRDYYKYLLIIGKNLCKDGRGLD